MVKYKITCLFVADWNSVYHAVFKDAVHSYSETYPEYAIYGFDTPQTPADLGPLVKVETVPSP